MSEEGGRGGFARLAAIVKAERASGKHVLVVHAGDAFSPSLMSGFDKGEHIVALLNALKLDIFVPGNHEFDFGKDVYAKRIGEAEFPVLAANLRGADGQKLPKHQDHMLVDIEGVKVGITGASLDETPNTSSSGDLKFASTFDTVAAEAKALKSEGADLTVSITHSTLRDDWKMFNTHLVDVLITGHTHDLRIEIAERFHISKPSISKHLSVLENAGLIRSEKKGQFVHCTLVRESLVNTLNGFVQEVCPVARPIKKESAKLAKLKAQ